MSGGGDKVPNQTNLQGSNGDADTENKLVDTVREGEAGTNGESSMETEGANRG